MNEDYQKYRKNSLKYSESISKDPEKVVLDRFLREIT